LGLEMALRSSQISFMRRKHLYDANNRQLLIFICLLIDQSG
jgi:hypothetical protein